MDTLGRDMQSAMNPLANRRTGEENRTKYPNMSPDALRGEEIDLCSS